MIQTLRAVTSGRSSAAGFYFTFYYAGGAVGAVCVGFAYEAWGWTGSILLMAAVQFASAALAAVAWRAPGPDDGSELTEQGEAT
jgi:predicted MFS family arabinose efflux permease